MVVPRFPGAAFSTEIPGAILPGAVREFQTEFQTGNTCANRHYRDSCATQLNQAG
jgi:hypothetical protein